MLVFLTITELLIFTLFCMVLLVCLYKNIKETKKAQRYSTRISITSKLRSKYKYIYFNTKQEAYMKHLLIRIYLNQN